MCKMNASEIISSFNEIVSQASAGKKTAESVANQLYAKTSDLRKQADDLIMLARQLSGNASAEPVGRDTIYLKEGERHPKAPKPKRKPSKAKTKTKTIPDDQLTPEQLAARNKRREICKMMLERKKQKALVDKFAETKIS